MDKDTKKSFILLANLSSMGIAMGVMIFGCFFLGLYLDKRFGTGNFFTFFLLVLGIAAGFKNMYGLIKRSISDENTKEKKDGAGEEKNLSKKN